MDPRDLDELRSEEELLAYQKDVKSRKAELDAEYKGLPFPEEFRDEFAGLTKTDKEIDRRVRELQARRQELEADAQDPKRLERISDSFRAPDSSLKERDIYDLSTMRGSPWDPESTRHEFRDRGLRAIELMNFPTLGRKGVTVNKEDCQAHLERLMENTQQPVPGTVAQHILFTSNPVYRQAFGKALFGKSLSHEEQLSVERVQRALSLTGASGGFAVPVTLDPTVIPTSNSVVNPTRAISRIETISGSNTWNGVSSGAITATRQAEAAAVTDAAPTLAQPTATVTMARAFVPFSLEIEGDWVGMESEIGRLLQDAKDDDEGAQFVTGVGTTVFPQGFVVGTTNTVAAATGLTVTAANLYALEAALPPRFRPNEQFVANRGIYNVVRGIDTAGGAALWLYVSQGLVTQSPTPGNTGATLLGRGAWEASAMQATVVNATKIMVVGDFSYFLIVDRIGMNIEVVPHLFGAAQGNLPTGQRGILAYWRNTSKVLSASAFVALTGTT
jgi:HK97 family phage major capsid protein